MSRDRNKGYVPDPTYEGGEVKPYYTTLVGNPWCEDREPVEMPVARGAADELNRTDIWEWARVPGDVEHWSHFEGHNIRISVALRSWNEREVNDWKGRDEIRKTGVYEIAFNEAVVYGGMFGDPLEVLLTMRTKIKSVLSLPIDWRRPGDDYRGLIEGRRVFYRDKPATLGYWMPEQGCVMVKPLDPRDQLDVHYDEPEAKADLLSPHISWWRDENQMKPSTL